MKHYFLRRIIWGLAAVCVITFVNFLIIKLVPGDPVTALIGEYPAPPEYIAQIRHDLGIDKPLYEQFLLYIGKLLHGDFGFSFSNRLPVLPLIIERAQYTLLLIIPSILIALALGISFALLSARRPNGVTDNVISGAVALNYSMPTFWLGQILIIIFAVHFSWLPAAGMHAIRIVDTGWTQVSDVLLHMILPMICIVSFKLAVILRVARASIFGVLRDDFIITARAKGVPEFLILCKHVLPNAIVPIITVTGYQFGHALTSAILVESVFAWPGVGSLFVSAVANRDFPVIQGILVLSTGLVVLANLLADAFAAVADPRVRRNLRVRHG